MTQIAFGRMEQFTPKDKEVVKWIEFHFRVPGVRPFKAKLVENKNKEKDIHPDYFLYYRVNTQKGDSFRDIKVGTLWQKQKVNEKGETVKYMTGNMFINFKTYNIYIKRANKLYEDEKLGYLYDLFVIEDDNNKPQQNQSENVPEYNTIDSSYEETQISVDDEDIPF